jgi:RNA 3'-terminal phosphate cyclase (ATP)
MKLISDACHGKLVGGTVGSKVITLENTASSLDHDIESEIVGDCKTAGSIILLLQAVIPFGLCGTNKEIQWKLKGGTNATMAPQYDYWEQIFVPTLNKMGIASNAIEATVIRRGYFPKGGGEVLAVTKPCTGPLLPIVLTDRGYLKTINIRSFYGGNCPKVVALNMAKSAKSEVRLRYPAIPIHTTISFDESAIGSGSGILLVAETSTGCRLGGSALGSRQESPKESGIQAAKQLCETLEDGGCVDEYLQDQLIIYMALASGRSQVLTGSLTLHSKSAICVAEKFCNATFEIRKIDDLVDSTPDSSGRIPGKHIIRCEGIGFSINTSIDLK